MVNPSRDTVDLGVQATLLGQPYTKFEMSGFGNKVTMIFESARSSQIIEQKNLVLWFSVF